MDFQSDAIDFSQPLHGGRRTASKTIVFPHAVVSATAGITGYLAEYSGEDNHHLGMLNVRLNAGIFGNTASVTGNFELRGWSATRDDDYGGQIGFVVLVELKSAPATPRRIDLIITSAEFNQSTQFFRASRYLDRLTRYRTIRCSDRGAGHRRSPPRRLGRDPSVIAVDRCAQRRVHRLERCRGHDTVPINPDIVPKHDAAINQALNNDTLSLDTSWFLEWHLLRSERGASTLLTRQQPVSHSFRH
ncbi:MAG: hypothetical protein E5Y79_13075 [Mesorhizobium sp.]|uniref:hypothetical protein n=1 Tax=Mesorhizobium sp. TaxID=1871066 RepID=UPI0012078415|nr:hypothetical protein [Mesorhizobium sp.]TIL59667.1 MAG: hypothetical protein E5Y79_13075 [Mesorhizobium sp.]